MRYICTEPNRLQNVRQIVEGMLLDGDCIALDFETTSLDANSGEVRLTALSNGTTRLVIDHFKTGFTIKALEDILEKFTMIFTFYSKFEHQWLAKYCSLGYSERMNIVDIGLMRRALEGGGPLTLAQAIKYDLGVEVSKELQNSDWSGELTPEQLRYAERDAYYTFKLGVGYHERLKAGYEAFPNINPWKAFNILNNAVLPCMEIEQYGLCLDVEYHKGLVRMWGKRLEAARKALRKLVPETELPNLRSKKKISDLLKANLDRTTIEAWPKTEASGQLDLTRGQLRIASARSPYPLSRFFAALMVFNRADKYLSTYGETLITIDHMRGAVRGNINIAQAVTLRSSSSSPNMQNIPRSPLVRRSFVAPKGCKLVMADYKGIEIRVLAELSGDEALLEAQIYGDVHAEGAIVIYRLNREKYFEQLKKKDPRAKEQRSRAKGFTFQLTYGAAAGALSVTLRTSTEEAAKAIDAWASKFRRAYNFRQYQYELMRIHSALHLPVGARIFVPRNDRTIPVASNYPVQGTAAFVMYAALYHVWLLLQDREVGAVLAATVHDEILLIASEGHEEAAAKCLEEGMIRGYLEVFPNANTDNLVDLVIGNSWADKP